MEARPVIPTGTGMTFALQKLKTDASPANMKNQTSLLCKPVLLVLLCGLVGVPWGQMEISTSWNQSLLAYDADTHYFVDAWNETPTFADTLKWWHGPWGQKFRPFYRPIASTLFWLQYRCFGVNGKAQFLGLLVAWHLIALLILWRFLCFLLNPRDGTLIACLWGAQIGSVLHTMSAADALMYWKDIVESWHAIPNLLCLWCFTRYLRDDPSLIPPPAPPTGRGVQKSLLAALLFFFVALCVKELAYTIPFVLLLLLWHEKKLTTLWRATLPFFALAGFMSAFRFWALGGMGFRMGSNDTWAFRLVNDNLGGVFTRILNRDWLILAAFAFLLAMNSLFRRQRAMAMAFAAGGVALIMGTAHFAEQSALEVASRWMVPLEWLAAPLLALLLTLWWRTFTQRNTHQVFGAAWALITYLPLTSGANSAHIFYFVSIGWTVWLTYGLMDAVALGREALQQFLVRQKIQRDGCVTP